jgi:hypothetical protein
MMFGLTNSSYGFISLCLFKHVLNTFRFKDDTWDDPAGGI